MYDIIYDLISSKDLLRANCHIFWRRWVGDKLIDAYPEATVSEV